MNTVQIGFFVTISVAILFALVWFVNRTFFANILQTTGWQTNLIIALAIILIVGLVSVAAYQSQGWAAVRLFLFSLVGCVANWISEAIKNKPDNGDIKLDLSRVVFAMLFSPVVLMAVLTALGSNTGQVPASPPENENSGPLNILTLTRDLAPYLIAFQNGYFWQTIYTQATSK